MRFLIVVILKINPRVSDCIRWWKITTTVLSTVQQLEPVNSRSTRQFQKTMISSDIISVETAVLYHGIFGGANRVDINHRKDNRSAAPIQFNSREREFRASCVGSQFND